MQEITKEVKVYMVGNKEFLNKKEAEKYEEELKKDLNYVFFTIRHNPDLTEGRGYYKTTVIAVAKNYAEHATALKYCFEKFGSPLAFIMGCSPMANWDIVKSEKFETLEDLNMFKEAKVYDGIGDYVKLVDKEIIYINSKGEVITDR